MNIALKMLRHTPEYLSASQGWHAVAPLLEYELAGHGTQRAAPGLSL